MKLCQVLSVVAGMSIGSVLMAGASEWSFDQASGMNGWKLANMKSHTMDANGMKLVSGKDCQMIIGKLEIQAGEFPFVDVVMEMDKDNVAQLFFASTGVPFNEKGSVRAKVSGGKEQVVRFNCSANPLWTGTISGLRLDPTNKENVNIRVKSIKLSGYEWGFSAAKKLNGWKNNADMQDIAYTDDGFSFVSGKDAQMTSEALNLSADIQRKCEVVMKSDKNNTGQLFFCGKDGKLSEAKSIRFPVKASEDWATYQVDCGANALWTEQISRLRLDPVGSAGVKVEIKSIRMLP